MVVTRGDSTGIPFSTRKKRFQVQIIQISETKGSLSYVLEGGCRAEAGKKFAFCLPVAEGE